MKATAPTPHQAIARQFYDGMLQCAHDARTAVLPRLMTQFDARGLHDIAEQAFSKALYFHKRLNAIHNGLPGAPITHGTPRFGLEYFCCLSALNLYRLPKHTEQFKCELLTEAFFALCSEEELEWLGVHNASLPSFRRDTGHEMRQWRSDITKIYLYELRAKSSRDADIYVAIRRFLERNQLSKGTGVEVTPAMLEACAKVIDNNAGWLERYLKFHPF